VGSAQHAGRLGVHDHLSWPYEDRDDFVRRVQEFVRDGLALGLRCVYAADRPLEQLEAELASVPDLHAEVSRGAVRITVLGDLYRAGSVIDPDEMMATFAAATEDAVAQGYAGLRVVADATPLVRTPEQLAAFATWEHKADRYMTGHPLSAMCGFDRTELSASAAALLACLHPAARSGMATFGVFASDDHADLALAGELDVSATDSLRACLGRTGLEATRELVVDGTRLKFVDHRGLESIRDFASGFGATAVLRTSSGLPARLIDLLRLEGIRVEPATTERVLA
jgi:hypothetical protein